MAYRVIKKINQKIWRPAICNDEQLSTSEYLDEAEEKMDTLIEEGVEPNDLSIIEILE